MPIYHNCKQRSPEWFQLRLSIPTASDFSKILTPTGKLSTQSSAYADQLLAEWILGAPLENFCSEWMQRGQDMEPEAIAAFEFATGMEVKRVGFVTTDDGLIGASPDGLLGTDGVLEIKCPSPAVHVGYMRHRKLEKDYWVQEQGLLYVTGREFLKIESYHPDFPTVIVQVERDLEYIALLDSALREFVEGLLAARADLEARYGPFTRKQIAEPGPDDPGALGITDADVEEFVRQKFPNEARAAVDTGAFPMLDMNVAGELPR